MSLDQTIVSSGPGAPLEGRVADLERRVGSLNRVQGYVGEHSLDGGTHLIAQSVTTGALAAGSVTAEIIAANAVEAQHLAAIVTISSTIQTDLTNPKVVLNSSGIFGYNSGGAEVFRVNTDTGSVAITGVLTAGVGSALPITYLTSGSLVTGTVFRLDSGGFLETSATNPRVVIDSAGWRSYNASGVLTTEITNSTATFQGAIFRTGPAAGARVQLDSTGVAVYAADGVTKNIEITPSGGVKIVGGNSGINMLEWTASAARIGRIYTQLNFSPAAPEMVVGAVGRVGDNYARTFLRAELNNLTTIAEVNPWIDNGEPKIGLRVGASAGGTKFVTIDRTEASFDMSMKVGYGYSLAFPYGERLIVQAPTGSSTIATFTGPSGASQYSVIRVRSVAPAGSGYASGYNLVNTNGGEGDLRLADSGSGAAFYQEYPFLVMSVGSGYGIKLNAGGVDGNHIRIGAGGGVGIGMALATGKLDVNGAVHASSFPVSSDVRVKSDVRELRSGRDLARRLRPVRFLWNERAMEGAHETRRANEIVPGQIGFVAQDVAAVVPELVTQALDGRGTLGVDYSRIGAVAIAAVQEQDRELEDLRAEVDAIAGGFHPAVLAALERIDRRLAAIEAAPPIAATVKGRG